MRRPDKEEVRGSSPLRPTCLEFPQLSPFLVVKAIMRGGHPSSRTAGFRHVGVPLSGGETLMAQERLDVVLH